MVYISHRMEEVWQLAKPGHGGVQGRHVDRHGNSEQRLDHRYRTHDGWPSNRRSYQHEPRTPGKVPRWRSRIWRVAQPARSLEVKAGEVVSMSGLVGSGRTEVARLLFGADPRSQGSVRINGKVSHPSDPPPPSLTESGW